MVVIVKGDLRRLVLTENLGRMLRLEGCLAGNLPENVDPLPGACRELAETRPAKVVFGPATFLNQAVAGIQASARRPDPADRRPGLAMPPAAAAREAGEQGLPAAEQRAAAKAASDAVGQQFQQRLLRVASEFGITSLPRIDDPLFVSQVVFDTRRRRARRRRASPICSRTATRR